MGSTSKRWRTIGWLLLLAAGGWLGHAWLLRTVASPLISEDAPAEADFLCVRGDEFGVDGEDTCDRAAAWQREAPDRRRILVLEPWPGRIVEIGVLPSLQATVRRELQRRGVAADAILLVAGKARDEWEEASLLDAWLEQRPAAHVVLLCGRFHSGHLRDVLTSVLSPANSARISVDGVADSRYDETDWWKTRRGIKALLFGWLQRIHAWCMGEERALPRRLTAEEYLSQAQETYGEAP